MSHVTHMNGSCHTDFAASLSPSLSLSHTHTHSLFSDIFLRKQSSRLCSYPLPKKFRFFFSLRMTFVETCDERRVWAPAAFVADSGHGCTRAPVRGMRIVYTIRLVQVPGASVPAPSGCSSATSLLHSFQSEEVRISWKRLEFGTQDILSGNCHTQDFVCLFVCLLFCLFKTTF